MLDMRSIDKFKTKLLPQPPVPPHKEEKIEVPWKWGTLDLIEKIFLKAREPKED